MNFPMTVRGLVSTADERTQVSCVGVSGGIQVIAQLDLEDYDCLSVELVDLVDHCVESDRLRAAVVNAIIGVQRT